MRNFESCGGTYRSATICGMKTVFLVIAVVAVSLTNGKTDGNANPFRSVLDAEDFEKNFSAWEKVRARAREQASQGYPSVGVRMVGAEPGSAAREASIPPNSIIVARSEKKSWGGFLPEPLMGEPYVLHFVTPEGEAETRNMNAGPLGARVTGSHRIELAYLQGDVGKRDPAWDEEIIQACACWKSDRETCETALHSAVAKGYTPDALTDWFRVQLALLTEDGPEAEMEAFLGHFTDQPIPWVFIPPLHDVLLVSGRIDFMQRIEKEAGSNCAFDRETIERFLKWTNGEVTLPTRSLLERINEMEKVSINRLFESVDDDTEEERYALMGKQFYYRSPPRFLYQVVYRPEESAVGGTRPIPHDIHYNLFVTPFATGHDQKFATNFRVGFTYVHPEDEPPSHDPRFDMRGPPLPIHCVDVEIDKPFGNLSLISSNGDRHPGMRKRRMDEFAIAYIDDPKLPEPLGERFEKSRDTWTDIPDPLEFDLIRYGNEVAAFVNSICVLHLPTDPENNDEIEIALRSIGMEVYVHEQDLWELAQ